jgi:thiol-disulfide isomerase/thioredoxin
MKYQTTALGLLLSITLLAQQPGYEIKVTLKPFKNQYVYLGHYYGKQLPIIDSVKLDATSTGTFKGSKKLGGGVYLVGYPDRSNKFEMLVGKEQRFSVVADTAALDKISFVGSAENASFKAYQVFMANSGKSLDELYRKRAGSSPKDSLAITAQIDTLSKKIEAYRRSIMSQEPTSLLASLLRAMKEPEVPNNPEAQKRDSLYAYRYFKSHYWDGINLWDDRLTRTPFFESKVDKYFEQLVYPSSDSVIREIDWMMGFASASNDMQKFLLLKFVNRYLNQKYMWEDAVFVHLFEKYFAQKNYDWLAPQGRKVITDRAYSLMANITGTVASNIELPDSAGKTRALFNIDAPYTVVVIYDPMCGHCKETVPKLDSLYNQRWKAMGVKMFSMAKETDGKKSDWFDFMRKFGMKEWINVYYSKEAEKARVSASIPSYSQLYDVQSFPTLYLLDKDKRIIAKKVTENQLGEILEQRVKTATGKQEASN